QLNLGARVRAGRAAQAVGLEEDDIVTGHHEPQVASVGLPFLMVELRDREALGRAVPDIDVMRGLRAEGVTPDIHVYTRDAGDYDIQARMFAPLDGVFEDPATGSANCALAGFLTALDAGQSADRLTERSYRISQGSEMGRPSELFARTVRGASTAGPHDLDVYIGGYSVPMRSGVFEI
ncbi:MAG: PhzF family phenazine biosynthesis protein, partial [bacterium]